MSATIHLPGVLATLAGTSSLETKAGTLGEVVADVRERHPRLGPRLCDTGGRPHSFIAFFVNAVDARSTGGMTAPVHDGDIITIVSAIAGG